MKCQETIMRRIAPYSADVLDPFVLRRRISVFQKLKVLLLSVTLLPLRIILMFVLLLFAWVLAVTTLKGLPEAEKTKQKPISGWRKKWMKPFIVKLARLVFVVAGWHWIPTKGKRATAKEAPILLLVPHSSFWDTVCVIALGCPSLVIRENTENAPFFGDMVRYTQPVCVRRGEPSSRQKAINEILHRCHSGDEWEQFLIFPEGTCSNKRALLSFKLGAFYPGVPIQPVFIKYSKRMDTTTWTWDGPGALEQIWLTLSQFHMFCELEFLPVYNPTSAEKENPRLYADNLRKYISRQCGIPITYFSLDDIEYLKKAKSQKLPRTAALVKLLRIRKKYGRESVDLKTEQSDLQINFQALEEPMGDVSQFAKYIGGDVCEAVQDFFNIMDQDQVGKLDVRVYDVGLSLLTVRAGEWKRLEDCFKVFNTSGIITLEQFAMIALLWRGLPKSVSFDIFHVLNVEENRTISFETFKKIAKSYIEAEKANTKQERKNCWWCFQWKIHHGPEVKKTCDEKLKLY